MQMIKEIWFSEKKDYGLGRIAILAIFYNILFCLLGLFWAKRLFYHNFVVLLGIFPILWYREKLIIAGKKYIFTCHAFQLLLILWFNYDVIGQINLSMGGLPLYDQIIIQYDLVIFDHYIADYLLKKIITLGQLGFFIYDLLMISYVLFYFLPFYGIYLIYKNVQTDYSLWILRYTSSFVFLFLINFTFYLIVPVTGPQYFVKEFFNHPLPFNNIGAMIHALISYLHTNRIDCFPSAHTGVSILISFWMFKLNLPQKVGILICSILIILATVVLRFHYFIDVLFALPLATFCYYISYSFSSSGRVRHPFADANSL